MNKILSEKIIKRNEKDANIVVAKIFFIAFLLFTVVFLLNVLGIFVIYQPAMILAYVSSSVLLLSPLLINKLVPLSSKYLKYVYVSFAALFILIVSTTLTYHVVLIYAYPIALAGVYFSRRLTNYSVYLTIAVTVIGQLLGYFLQWRPDKNFPTLDKLIVFSIVPRLITLISFACLLKYLTDRTSKLMQDDLERYYQLSGYNQSMIYSFATLVESRDANTGGHIKRTSIYVKLLAEELLKEGVYKEEINEELIRTLSMVAPLHDIGKIAIPDSILQKPGKLTDEEFDIMKTHSEKGGDIIRETFRDVADTTYTDMAYDVAMYHHEKWNGNGYPRGLMETGIPLSARIMAVADVFDAVSEKRCYREAMPLEKCFSIIEEGSGTHFDPVLVKAFLNIRDNITAVHESQ